MCRVVLHLVTILVPTGGARGVRRTRRPEVFAAGRGQPERVDARNKEETRRYRDVGAPGLHLRAPGMNWALRPIHGIPTWPRSI